MGGSTTIATAAPVAFSLHGMPIGGGVAIGRALVLQPHGHDVARYRVEPQAVPQEQRRLEDAIDEVDAELQALARDLPDAAPPEARALLEVHALILRDPTLADGARALVGDECCNAEWALWNRAVLLAEQFEALDDPYLRERGRDVRQVVDRVLKVLAGDARRGPAGGAGAALAEPTIVVADDIAPADLLHWRGAAGFCIDLGGAASHSAILARSFGKPAVVGLGGASSVVRDGDLVIVDGDAGALIVSPDEGLLAVYRQRKAEAAKAAADLRRLVGVRARTRCGVDVGLMANIELPVEAAMARELGAEGVGLMRSEFLFLGRSQPPGEDEQFEAYREAVKALEGRPLTVRTIDVGADKAMPADGPMSIAPSANPALGRRAIRFSLAEPAFFLVQLRAILRASAHGPIRLLLPLLTSPREVEQAMRLIAQARAQLAEAGTPQAPRVPVGGMIEVPAAAIASPWFARRLDFLSIGTNDLVQYTLAIDRTDDAVASLYDPMHPAVLRLIGGTIAAGRRAGKPVAVCGEMAGQPGLVPLLLGLGLREFSMDSSQLLRVKEAVLGADLAEAKRVARRALRDFGSDS